MLNNCPVLCSPGERITCSETILLSCVSNRLCQYELAKGWRKDFQPTGWCELNLLKTERPDSLNAGTLFSQENRARLPAGLWLFLTSVRTAKVPADRGCSAARLLRWREAAMEQCKNSPQIHWRIHKFVSDSESDGWKSCDACYLHVSDLRSGKVNGLGWNTLWVYVYWELKRKAKLPGSKITWTTTDVHKSS